MEWFYFVRVIGSCCNNWYPDRINFKVFLCLDVPHKQAKVEQSSKKFIENFRRFMEVIQPAQKCMPLESV